MKTIKQILLNKYFLAVICIAAATALFLPGRDYFAKGQWSLLYLLVIALVARLWGAGPAILASFIAFLAWDFFFLPPFNTLIISDARDLLSLGAFLIVGTSIGYLTGRMKDRETLAMAREKELEILNRFGAHLVSDMKTPEMAEALLREIKAVTNAAMAALFLPDDRGGVELLQATDKRASGDWSIQSMATWVFHNVKAIGLPANPGETSIEADIWPISVSHNQAGANTSRYDVFIPLQSASRIEGVLYVGERQSGQEYSPQEARLLVAIANQSAAFLERQRLQSEAVLVDALRESDKMKSTLISSVSHELKTPLASAIATTTNLLQSDIKIDDDAARDEIQAVQNDLDRLNNSISSLIDLSRLEAADWTPKIEIFELGEIIASVLSKTSPRQKPRILLSIPEDLPAIRVDFTQWVQALQNVLENALAYSPGDKKVTIGASRVKNGLEIWIADEGPGIPLEERHRVFDKFFRGRLSSISPTGTGLGLAVAREIVNYHGARIRIGDASPHGTRVVITLPNESLSETGK